MRGGALIVTKTINQLHFEDLDPIRFEELILGIVYRMNRWETINHFGKKGSDDGIDICATEMLENQKERTHHFQCKRYTKITQSVLKKIIDDFISKNIILPSKYYLIVSCNLSKKNTEYFKKYAKGCGLENTDVWTSTIIETKLYSDYPDLLFSYFGISLSKERNNKISSLRRNISLKHKLQHDLLKSFPSSTNEERMSRIRNPFTKFNCNNILIRSIDDTDYPKQNFLEQGHYAYQKSKLYNFYYNGLIVFAEAACCEALVKEYINDEEYTEQKINVFVLGYMPFNNIIDYDLDGDEFYQFPHFFCDFENGQNPFEFIRFAFENDNGFWILDDEDVISVNGYK